MTAPILIACAHGTDSPAGRAEIHQLRAEIAGLLPEVEVREAYVDVQEPSLPDVVAGLPEGVPAVIVPLLLSVGYHVKVDIARAAKSRPMTTSAAPLGPDHRLAEVLAVRLASVPAAVNDFESGHSTEDAAVVLAAAGSSDPEAAVAVAEVARHLAELIPNLVTVGFGAGAEPKVPAAVEMARTKADLVVIASYLLAPGFFHDQLSKAGANSVAAPLLPSPAIAQIAVDRYDAATKSL